MSFDALKRPPASSGGDIAGLVSLPTVKRRWPAILAAILTAAMVVGLFRELFSSGLAGLERAVPADPRFYLFFGLLYLSPPTGDYIIFRRLWGIPIAGFGALMRKRIANEVVFGYSGDAYFYAWARSRAKMVAAPFGAIKDVTILSAIAGNGITLLMLALALPLGQSLLPPVQLHRLAWSAVVVVAISLPFLIFSKRVFSLPRRRLWWIFGVHCIRLITGSTLLAVAWHFAMPDVSIAMWLFLSAGRLLVSRLPLVPNKDLLFANFAILLIGRDESLSALIAFSAGLILLIHIVVLIGFGIAALASRRLV